MVGEIIGSVVVFGGLLGVVAIYVWADRDQKRIWSTGTEAERFDDLISDVETFWKAGDVDPGLRRELKAELVAFCAEAQQTGATTTQVFGNDIEAFAAAWVDEHRTPPNQLKLALLRFLAAGAAWLAVRGVIRTFHAIGDNSIDDPISAHVIFATAWGFIAAVGPLVGRRIERRVGYNSTGLRGLASCLGSITLLFAALFGAIFLFKWLSDALFRFDAFAKDEFVPGLASSLLLTATAIPLLFWATSENIKENDKQIAPLFDEAEDDGMLYVVEVLQVGESKTRLLWELMGHTELDFDEANRFIDELPAVVADKHPLGKARQIVHDIRRTGSFAEFRPAGPR